MKNNPLILLHCPNLCGQHKLGQCSYGFGDFFAYIPNGNGSAAWLHYALLVFFSIFDIMIVTNLFFM